MGSRKIFINIYHTVDYMARGFMSFMRGVDITGSIGRVGLKVEPVLGPEMYVSVGRKKNFKCFFIFLIIILKS